MHRLVQGNLLVLFCCEYLPHTSSGACQADQAAHLSVLAAGLLPSVGTICHQLAQLSTLDELHVARDQTHPRCQATCRYTKKCQASLHLRVLVVQQITLHRLQASCTQNHSSIMSTLVCGTSHKTKLSPNSDTNCRVVKRRASWQTCHTKGMCLL